MARARRGDAEAFADLCVPYERRAYNLALRLCGDPGAAEDICQEAFLRVFRGIRAFRGDAAFGTWLFRIVHNLCVDAARRRPAAVQVPLESQEGLADPHPGPEDAVLRAERRALFLAALDRLGPSARAAVVLRDVQGFAYEEASAVAGVPVGTFKSRLHRARAELRTLLHAASLVGEPAGQ